MQQNTQESLPEKAITVGDAIEHVVEEIAEDLQVALPAETSNPFGVRFVTLLTLLGGIAIVGGVFADSYSLHQPHIGFYFFRLIVGCLLIFIAFGLNHRKLFAIWLFGLVAVLGWQLNPITSLLPILAVAYLYKKRALFVQTGVLTYKNFTLRF